MSNCVQIHTDIVIPTKLINTINLFHDMEEINKLKDVDHTDTLKDYIIWWFLSERNVTIEGDDLIISLGNHRSMHTQRDLRQVGFVLAEYVAPGALAEGDFIYCPMEVSDEYDGFETIETQTLKIAPYTEK